MRLSMVCRGRNDSYGGPGYLDRTKYCLTKHINNFIEAGLTPADVEIVFTDWGSEESIVPLLLSDGHGFLRYIIVPPKITAKYDPPDTKFDFVTSVNVAAARAKGEYIMHIDPDVFMAYSSFNKLWKCLANEGFHRYQYYFTRFTIDATYLSEPDNHVMPSISPAIEGTHVFNGYSTAVLASKKAWFTVGGYDEKFTRWGQQDIDMFARLYNSGYMAKDLYKTDAIVLVHIDHEHKVSVPNQYEYRHPTTVHPNGPNWGIQDMTFEEVTL